MGEYQEWDEPVTRSRAVPGFDGAKLRHLRKTRAMLTQAELADLAGVCRAAVSHLELGRRNPMATTLRGLCVALGCDPDDLILEGTVDDYTGDGSGPPSEATEEPRQAV